MDLIWFKRDLRLSDHEPLAWVIAQQRPAWLLYIFEPELIADGHYSERHWRFVWQSLEVMQRQLSTAGHRLLILHGEATEVLQQLYEQQPFERLCSYEEIGLQITWRRDLRVKRWCKEHRVEWREWPSGAVIRGASNRLDWDKHWQQVTRAPLATVDLRQLTTVATELPNFQPPDAWQQKQAGMQTGGSDLAWRTLEHFFEARGQYYQRYISKPLQSRSHCSRLSPYLAWGNISLREVYQTLLKHWQRPGWRRALSAFSSRLHWHCHFIQKFESETRMELQPVNRGYEAFPYRSDYQEDLLAWMEGRTGIPLVDANMRCLWATGYINFRMRAMLVSVLCHHLNIHWRLASEHLARLFIDFEPGIHYPQIQMQAGVTGTNTLRIYNPVKQAQEQDPEALFIRRWLPELAELPTPLVIEPWQLTPLEEQLYQFQLGREYPAPIIVLDAAAKAARDRLWRWRERPDVQADALRILARHVRPAQPPPRPKHAVKF